VVGWRASEDTETRHRETVVYGSLDSQGLPVIRCKNTSPLGLTINRITVEFLGMSNRIVAVLGGILCFGLRMGSVVEHWNLPHAI
jgi:hypothetical protein